LLAWIPVFLLPWQFSPTVVAAIGLAAVLYRRGSSHVSVPVPVGRRTAFYLGLLVIYAALQTSWEYYASHMIFVLQLQHFALHDLAPVLLAWAAPRVPLAAGLPSQLHVRATRVMRVMRVMRAVMRLLLNPFVAGTTYVAALLLWMWPPVTFDVMLSNGLYKLMSWSVLAGALPFWALVLDPRPYPLARLKPGHRIVMLHLVMLPVVLTGAALTLSGLSWYPVYAVCGRFLPIPPVADQQLGGVVMWVLSATLYAIAFFIVLGRNLEQEEAALTVRQVADHSW
jgi:putative membrane protein